MTEPTPPSRTPTSAFGGIALVDVDATRDLYARCGEPQFGDCRCDRCQNLIGQWSRALAQLPHDGMRRLGIPPDMYYEAAWLGLKGPEHVYELHYTLCARFADHARIQPAGPQTPTEVTLDGGQGFLSGPSSPAPPEGLQCSPSLKLSLVVGVPWTLASPPPGEYPVADQRP